MLTGIDVARVDSIGARTEGQTTAFLRDQAGEHAMHTARLTALMSKPAGPPNQWVGAAQAIAVSDKRKRLRIAYLTGHQAGMASGLMFGIPIGIALTCCVLLLGIYAQSQHWSLP